MFALILNTVRAVLIPIIMLCSGVVLAADKVAGKQLVLHGNHRGATACQTCHALNGSGDAATAFPRLAGLNADYLVRQLENFVKDARKNMIMQPIAKALNHQEMENAAAYFASLKPLAPISKSKVDPTLYDEGKALVELGAWDEKVPGTTFPALAGQHASYLVAELNAWKEGIRKNDPLELMHGIGSRLDEEQIKAVGAYLSTLNPAH
jgi:cytochrome c553